MFIETERLIIRSLRPSDEKDFIEMASDGSLTEIYGDCSECHKWMGKFISNAIRLETEDNPYNEYLAFAIENKINHMVIGSVGSSYYEDFMEVGVTYFIGAGYRGNGYAAEALKCLADYMFGKYNLKKLVATAGVENIASCKTLERVGFSVVETKMYQDLYDESEAMSNIYEMVKKMYAYHVVTDRPMYVGQQIIFDETHHSGLFQRVYEKLDMVNEIYSNPSAYDAKILEYHTSVALRELALEEVRQNKFPQYPSRLSCLYVSGTFEEADNWGKFFAEIGRPTYHIVKLEIEGNCFMGDATKCFEGQLDKEENLKLAELYWKSGAEDTNQQVICEMLADGRITVTEIVKEINANTERN